MADGHRRSHDAPGADRALKKLLQNLGWSLLYMDRYNEEIQEARPTLTGITVRCDPDDEMGVLAVIKGYEGSKHMVAFHRGLTISDTMLGLGSRLRNGSLKWREDNDAKYKRHGS